WLNGEAAAIGDDRLETDHGSGRLLDGSTKSFTEPVPGRGLQDQLLGEALDPQQPVGLDQWLVPGDRQDFRGHEPVVQQDRLQVAGLEASPGYSVEALALTRRQDRSETGIAAEQGCDLTHAGAEE